MIYVLVKHKDMVELRKHEGLTGPKKIAMRLREHAENTGRVSFYLWPYENGTVVGVYCPEAAPHHGRYTGWFAGEPPAAYEGSEWFLSALHKFPRVSFKDTLEEVQGVVERLEVGKNLVETRDGEAEPDGPNPDYVAPYQSSGGGAMRESIGTKVRTHLVPYELTIAAAIGLNYGEFKYDARNWEKGFDLLDVTHSVERHNKAIMNGEEIDADSGLPHYILLASSTAMLVGNMMRGIHTDDRPAPVDPAYSVSELASKFTHMQTAAIENWKKKQGS